ncbi:MAG: D-isomer specific 2-hydroxyacid dehydrogenase NAD-binding protein [Rhodospirillales bacterium]|jgi:phosphoglycerate dehydrogenase-like enzyme|nr:D-isomer specific 2-hydroxyacid dehydrogenase NAD-binding protein [Rhodospirillales bacterium]
MRVVFGTTIARPPVKAALEKISDIEVVEVETIADVIPLAHDADVLVISDPRGEDGKNLVAELKKPGCKVRLVQVLSAGFEGLSAHGVPANIPVANQGGAVAPAVADHAIGMILAMTRQISQITLQSKQQVWNKDFARPVVALEGKTMAIIGYGNIGREIAKRAKAFDVTVLGVSRSLTSDEFADEMHPMTDLHKVLARADVIALAVASSKSTYQLMNAAAFSAAKKGALFVNVTRGETVDQAALKQALESGQLAAAFIDVTDPEPLPKNDPLWTAPNLVISPHAAGGGSTRGGSRIAGVVRENIERLKTGRDFIHLIKT